MGAHPWPDLGAALAAGSLVGSSGELHVLHAAASIADGYPVDLGDLAAGLDRRALTLVLAAIADAAGSHEHTATSATAPTASPTLAARYRRSCPGPAATSDPASGSPRITPVQPRTRPLMCS